jgi:hypothetical protein
VRFDLKFLSLATALALAACGGSGGDAADGGAGPNPPPEGNDGGSTPSVVAPYQAALVAGFAWGTAYEPPPTPMLPSVPVEDPDQGCIDGAALGAKLSLLPPANPPAGPFAKKASGELLLGEWGRCDRRARIRVIDPAGNTIRTLAAGASSEDTQASTAFLTPVAIAVGRSGDIYIGDSGIVYSDSSRVRGTGIWKIDADGNVSVVAGAALTTSGGLSVVDGAGLAASFGYIQAMCLGSDGLLYVDDAFRLRTVTVSGDVTTVTTPNVKQQHVLACGPDGSVLMHRRFNDPADDDFYDPVAGKSIAKASAAGPKFITPLSYLGPLAYLGPANPSVVIQTGGPDYSLVMLNLIDGSSATIASHAADSAADLTATPPAIAAIFWYGAAIDGTDFDLVTSNGVMRFARKP